ncbi:MAG: hypothetical protein AAF608_05030 [Pseudomonadota bacterium]
MRDELHSEFIGQEALCPPTGLYSFLKFLNAQLFTVFYVGSQSISP